MNPPKDLTGQRFGKLIAQERADRKYELSRNYVSRHWFCKCDCGGHRIVSSSSLTKGYVKSCGCVGGPRKTRKDKGIPRTTQRAKSRRSERVSAFMDLASALGYSLKPKG